MVDVARKCLIILTDYELLASLYCNLLPVVPLVCTVVCAIKNIYCHTFHRMPINHGFSQRANLIRSTVEKMSVVLLLHELLSL